MDKISCLDSDLILDDFEKEFIDYICMFDVSLVAQVIDGFISDGNISVVDVHEMHFLEKYTAYLSKFEDDLQNKISTAFLTDGKVSSAEAHQMDFLDTFSEAEQIEFVENGKFANCDWDGDNMNNYFEKEIAHLPYEVHNGRYAILVDTFDTYEFYGWEMYEFLIKEQNILPLNIYNLIYTNATITNFEQATEELAQKVNRNDLLLVILDGHGSSGSICFNDGYGNNQNATAGMLYKEIDTYLDRINSYATIIAPSTCYAKSSFEPLKEGPSPRIVVTLHRDWLFSPSIKYTNGQIEAMPKQYDYIAPKDYDIDGNGYVSIKESFETMMSAMKRYFFIHPEGANVYGIMDPNNIASSLYLGDFEIQD